MMMMMMTGRVLLVCALCVLWCGAGGGGCSEIPPAPETGVSDNGKDSKIENKSVVSGEDDQTGKSRVSETAASLVPEVPVAGVTQTHGAQALGTMELNKKKTNEKDEEEEEEEEEEEAEDEDEAREYKGNEMKEEKEEDSKEAVTSTTNGMSADGQEQQILSSGAEGASNITNPNSTQTTGDDDPAADGAGTADEKQNENKDANPKKTPVEATAMKTTTATTGDSDGSTAVSHTTSPLLLLIVVVACAAAAVVAA
ncbi:mucin-associated surface protein (MASP) [Trypanosoma cruzi Dm28c]|uniref:Mucin-associated surface protein (MASP) n=2 Tax=Trypanosoma cruzi TaxID=5693 RepID=V5ARB5_TRYCR|nr:mucin-associated surface protein (MASP) [Trypanosoma cruzi Dm28c]PBJ77062.1 mucin-associated surface protein [Trypanosoma cruzi cruzi]PBJ80141.1 mucin-associated surface protein [Trypanosoma cruzi cruzi]